MIPGGEALYSPAFQVSLLLAVALGGYLLASRMNQSAVVGEILAGLVVGPSVLGLITYTDFVAALAELGAIIMLFVIGFEFNIRDLTNSTYGVIGFFGVLVPWVGGYIVAVEFGYSFSTAVVIGVALTATSIAITANVLREMGVLHTEVAKAIIGAAVIDDILSLIALSLSIELISGSLSFDTAVFLLIKQIGFIAIASLVGHYIISRWLHSFDKSPFARKYPEFIFIFAIMMAFLYASFAEFIGMSGIIGAFIAGVSFSQCISFKHSHSIKGGANYLYIIFASMFFVSLGVLVDLHHLTPHILIFALVLIAIAIITKLIGCGLSAKLMGMNTKDSLILGFGMVPRGEVAMIVGLMGLNMALIGQDIYIAILLMSLLTTIFTPIIYRGWLYKDLKKEGEPT
ncbi:MAG: cation:proton antiporter [Methanomicrobiales archaeon]|jgi:Kef-type K+ transport system membrane component KefB|nr:cation:proton antiporter [Methanomicrobiales archaeon]